MDCATAARCDKVLDPRTVSASSVAVDKPRRTPSPAFIPLPSSARPAGRTRQLAYTDQYGWCPFDDYQFVYAAKAALELSQTAFGEMMSQEGGLWEFWNQAKLPYDTAPTWDTKGLCLWEIDDLLNSIRQQSTLPEPVTCMIVEDFKSVIARYYFRSHGYVDRQEQIEEDFDTSSVFQGEPFSHDDKSFGLFPPPSAQFDEPLGGDMDDAVDCMLDDVTNLAHGDLSCSSLANEEKREKVAKVLENFDRKRLRDLEGESNSTFVKRLGTMNLECSVAGPAFRSGNDEAKCLRISQKEEYETETKSAPELVEDVELFRRRPVRAIATESKWSARSKRNRDESSETAETTSTHSPEPTDEDEKYCQGIV